MNHCDCLCSYEEGVVLRALDRAERSAIHCIVASVSVGHSQVVILLSHSRLSVRPSVTEVDYEKQNTCNLTIGTPTNCGTKQNAAWSKCNRW